MGLNATLTATKVNGSDGEKFDIQIVVDNKGGGGGTFQADVTSTYPNADFTLDVSSVSPRADSVKANLITWSDRTCMDDGTTFQYQISCNSATSAGTVQAMACKAGSTTDCVTSSANVSCK